MALLRPEKKKDKNTRAITWHEAGLSTHVDLAVHVNQKWLDSTHNLVVKKFGKRCHETLWMQI